MEKLFIYIGWKDLIYGFIIGAIFGGAVSYGFRPSPMEPFKERPKGTTTITTQDSVFYIAYIIYGKNDVSKRELIPQPPYITP